MHFGSTPASGSLTGQAPSPTAFSTSSPTPGRTCSYEGHAPFGPAPDRGSSGSSGLLPGAGTQLRAWGSYPAVGCPHRHLPLGPRQLRTRPHLLAAARGLGAAPLPPCSVARTRLSGTRAQEGPRTRTPAPALHTPPVGKVPLLPLTQATPPVAHKTLPLAPDPRHAPRRLQASVPGRLIQATPLRPCPRAFSRPHPQSQFPPTPNHAPRTP